MSVPPSKSRLRPWHLLIIGIAGLVGVSLLPSGPKKAVVHKRIVCTFLPMYVFGLNVTKDVPDVSVELLVNANVGCPHEYSLRPDDLKSVAQADVIVTNGLDLDPFLDQLKQAAPHAQFITLSDNCDVLPEEHHSGDVHHHDHVSRSSTESRPHSIPSSQSTTQPAATTSAEASETHESESNPHVWVSPYQASKQVMTLAGKLALADPINGLTYLRNANAYVAGPLSRLQAECSVLRQKFASTNRNIVTFHDAFAYLARDLDLNVVATLTQEPDHAPSAHEIAETIDTIRNTHAAAIFFEPAYSDQLARRISGETGVPLFPLNPFNSIDVPPTPESYEKVMEQNLKTLQRALGGGA